MAPVVILSVNCSAAFRSGGRFCGVDQWLDLRCPPRVTAIEKATGEAIAGIETNRFRLDPGQSLRIEGSARLGPGVLDAEEGRCKAVASGALRESETLAPQGRCLVGFPGKHVLGSETGQI